MKSLTYKEISKLEHLVWNIIYSDDFEHQDEDYQEFMLNLHGKLFDMLGAAQKAESTGEMENA